MNDDDFKRTSSGFFPASVMSERFARMTDAQVVVTRCALCRWVHRGTFAEGRDAAAAHRRERHPDAKPSGVRRRSARAQRAEAMKRSEWKRERWGA